MNIGSLPWIEDGIEMGGEFNAARGMVLLAKAGYLPRLLEEPWVVDGSNLPALESLWLLEINKPETLAKIMSHPTISDGISEKEAKIIAVITPGSPPDLVEKLLDPAQFTLEERTITLPLVGETDISIVRTGPGTDHAIESLVHAVRSAEEFMGLPFPRRHVLYIFTIYENPPVGGTHFGSHVKIFVDDRRIGKEATASILAHETSHYYWAYGVDWIREGAATFFESIAGNTTHGPLDQPPCPHARNITELEELERELSNPQEVRLCHYRLGERLFRDLYRNMNDTTFRLGFRRLYLHTLFPVSDDCNDDRLTDCHVKEAFTAYAPAEKTPIIEKVIDRWYDGSEPYDLSYIEDTPVTPEIAAISGRVDNAYLSITRGGPTVSVVMVGPNRNPALYLNLDYSHRNSSGLTSLPIEIALYFEDGLEFRRIMSELALPAEASSQTHHVQVPYERVPGRYWVQVYTGEQKIAEATFEAVSEPDPHNIRGMITYTGGQPPKEFALSLTRGTERFRAEVGPDGAFNVEVPPGAFIMQVRALFGSHWHFAGWYDGAGITTDPTRASEIVVDDGDVEGIEIMISADTYPHSIRGVVTDAEGQPVEGLRLYAQQGQERLYEGKTRSDGMFDIVVSSGSYNLVVLELDDSVWSQVGWYDGTGITEYRIQALEVLVEDTDVEGIEIVIPTELLP